MPYKFISIEGLDRSGKTTISKLLEEKLKPSVTLKFPDRATRTGEIIDKFLRKEIHIEPHELHLLYSANRYEKAEYIRSTLKHSNIICDRYWISGTIYSTAKGLDYEWCKATDKYLPQPDFSFFIDIDASETSKRREFGNEAHDKVEFQNKIYNLYKKHANSLKLVVVDGNRPSEEILSDILINL